VERRWVAVVLRDGRFERAIVAPRIDDLLSGLSDMAAIGIDMPIGLTSGTERREADTEARRFVGPRGSSVFPTYPREVYAALDYNMARERCLTLTGGSRSISRQAHALGERVLELEKVAAVRDDIWEVHPEVSFCAMAGRHLAWTKTSWNGLHESESAFCATSDW
jgi:predicted RNase H-like nuclease